MDNFDWFSLSSALFLVRYVFTLKWNPFHKKTDDAFIYFIIPAIIYFGGSRLSIWVTPASLMKHGLFLMFLMQIAHFFVLKNMQHSHKHAISIFIGILVLILIAFGFTIPAMPLNVFLIIFNLFIATECLILSKSNALDASYKESFESYLLLLLSVLFFSFGRSFYMMFIGIIVLIIYQVSNLYVTVKAIDKHMASQRDRLIELESRFEKAVSFESKKRTSHIVDHMEQIKEKSMKDPMTKALNRNGIINEINALILDQSVKIFSVAIFDIDFFKQINDTKGHIIGDECLKFLSYTFMVNSRKIDVLGRYGGDEFIFIMPHLNAPAAFEACERLRKEIIQKSTPQFSISMGISTYPYDGKSINRLIEVADEALYLSKNNGRNRVSYCGSVPLLK